MERGEGHVAHQGAVSRALAAAKQAGLHQEVILEIGGKGRFAEETHNRLRSGSNESRRGERMLWEHL